MFKLNPKVKCKIYLPSELPLVLEQEEGGQPWVGPWPRWQAWSPSAGAERQMPDAALPSSLAPEPAPASAVAVATLGTTWLRRFHRSIVRRINKLQWGTRKLATLLKRCIQDKRELTEIKFSFWIMRGNIIELSHHTQLRSCRNLILCG